MAYYKAVAYTEEQKKLNETLNKEMKVTAPFIDPFDDSSQGLDREFCIVRALDEGRKLLPRLGQENVQKVMEYVFDCIEYGVDGVMIWCGIFQNPFAFEKEPKDHSSEELLYLLRLDLDLYDEYSKDLELRPFTALHRFFKIYVKGFRGASGLRNQLMSTKSTDEVRTLLDNFWEGVEGQGQ
ncbi:hypothetical protein BALCAV_0214335 [Alkalihalobacillus alcalophilus ATCC 27647 = CGMCC 1.3604]|uniref:Uncharacterized protein n=1 Tax=Alkalihalobacillus alcalophilus ATCC 27647 = CGMCC 1.3604 TaxID=1218173 RepID=A0A094WIV9_ALKAL|nr:hypothetical protein BALCAV_0214335 [Alkalihalobacillus alcalophilus ATCC 27647 = CGMCC 1.3604]